MAIDSNYAIWRAFGNEYWPAHYFIDAEGRARGEGAVTEQRLYQLVRQSGQVTDQTFEIQFLDPGVEAYAFTFG